MDELPSSKAKEIDRNTGQQLRKYLRFNKGSLNGHDALNKGQGLGWQLKYIRRPVFANRLSHRRTQIHEVVLTTRNKTYDYVAQQQHTRHSQLADADHLFVMLMNGQSSVWLGLGSTLGSFARPSDERP